MIKSSYRYLLYLLFCTTLFSAEYKTLYLMEFENSSSDYRIDYLRKYFPELIKSKYSNRDFEIGYAPNLLSSESNLQTRTLKNGLLLYGKYSSSFKDIIVSFEIYDVNTWEEKSARSYRCKRDDVECIENAFLVCIDEDVMPLFCDQYDCSGLCNGTAVLDCNGDCQGDAFLDCNNECNGRSYLNECKECVKVENDTCIKDCANEWGGDAIFNECNICVSGQTGLSLEYGTDCFGVCGGSAVLDCNGICNGDAFSDCNGDCNGNAYFNDCNVCVGGLTANPVDLGKDCNGICFGGDTLDLCGICGGDNESCSDCLGVPYGKAYLDECGICDTNAANDCKKDCNEDWGGEAYINECQVCVGGNSGIEMNAGLDCKGICWGLSSIDKCGKCNGIGAIYACGCEKIDEGKCDCEGNVNDCLGVCGGDAKIDECGVCNGNGSTCNNSTNKNLNKTSTNISLYPLLDKVLLNNDKFNKIPCENCIEEPDVNIIGELFDNNNEDEKKSNTDRFLYVVDELFKNAYNIFVQEMEVEKNHVQNTIRISVPIEYSVKKDLFETLLSDLVYQTKTNKNGTFIIEILKDDIYLDSDLEEYFSLMKYQIVPVLFFLNENETVQHIHVDSWTDNYNFSAVDLDKNIDLSLSDQFSPLFSITPGEKTIQLNFDPNSQTSTYEFIFSLDEFNQSNYSKISLEFFYESNLEGSINSFALKR